MKLTELFRHKILQSEAAHCLGWKKYQCTPTLQNIQHPITSLLTSKIFLFCIVFLKKVQRTDTTLKQHMKCFMIFIALLKHRKEH